MAKVKLEPRHGTSVLVITPTRELCMQINAIARALMQHHTQITCGFIVGGTNRRAEAGALVKGLNLIASTPGRLLLHLQSTPGFNCPNLQMLVIDEADRCLEMGFEAELDQIVRMLPAERQTLLFAATLTQQVQDVAKLWLKPDAKFVASPDT